jgi:NADH dehydrogenase
VLRQNILSDIAGKPRDSFQYLDKGIRAMIGRNSAVAEVGEHRHELQWTIAFAACLGVHATLLTSTRVKIEAFIEGAWDYLGGARGDAVLDRSEELKIDWNDDGKNRFPPSRPKLVERLTIQATSLRTESPQIDSPIDVSEVLPEQN